MNIIDVNQNSSSRFVSCAVDLGRTDKVIFGKTTNSVGRVADQVSESEAVMAGDEIDAVIDPADTRQWLIRGRASAGKKRRPLKRYVDVW